MAEYKDLPRGDSSLTTLAPAHRRIITALITGIVVGVLASTSPNLGKIAFLLGWNSMAIVWLVWVWHDLQGFDAMATANHAVREDPGRAAIDLLLVLASLGSLVAVGLLLVGTGQGDGKTQLLLGAFGMMSVVLSWAVVHTTFALHYARQFYRHRGGIDFNSSKAPNYADFAYLAFTLGMTFQVSDTAISSSIIRRTVLRHALLSYLFGVIIIATTINLVAGLFNK